MWLPVFSPLFELIITQMTESEKLFRKKRNVQKVRNYPEKENAKKSLLERFPLLETLKIPNNKKIMIQKLKSEQGGVQPVEPVAGDLRVLLPRPLRSHFLVRHQEDIDRSLPDVGVLADDVPQRPLVDGLQLIVVQPVAPTHFSIWWGVRVEEAISGHESLELVGDDAGEGLPRQPALDLALQQAHGEQVQLAWECQIQ
jgi:hypothetical protein